MIISLLETHRTLLAVAFVALLGSISLAQDGDITVPDYEITETKVISLQPNYFHGWGSAIRRKNGELFVVYSGGREDHAGPFGRTEMMNSRDEGKTWSWPRVIMDSATDDRDSGILETNKGTLLVTFLTSYSYKKHLTNPERRINKVFKEGAEGHIKRAKLADQRLLPKDQKSDTGHWLLRSTDGGQTWSRRLPMPCYSPHGPTQMADGRILFAGADGKKNVAFVSDDDGLTWKHLSDIPGRPGETHGLEAADGTLIVHVRDKVAPPGGGKRRWATTQTESSDGGITWSKPHEIVAGFPSHLLRLKNDDLLMSYGVRVKPYGIRAKLSKDNGKTWSKEILIRQDSATEDLGYPTTVQLGDGSLLTIWYEVPADSIKAQLKQAKWYFK